MGEDYSELSAKVAVMQNDIGHIREVLTCDRQEVKRHVQEGEAVGGYRDQVLTLKLQVDNVKRGIWKVGLTSGFIGALVGSGSKDAIVMLINWFIGK